MTMRPLQHLSTPADVDFHLDDYPQYNLIRTSSTYVDAMASLLSRLNDLRDGRRRMVARPWSPAD